MRESGYYRVKIHGRWLIGQYVKDGSWFLCGNEFRHINSDFEAIDENRIAPEPNSFETKDFDLDTRI